MSYRFRSSRRNDESTCRCCGKTTYRSLDDHFPECSHGCAEWIVDSKGEWMYLDNDR